MTQTTTAPTTATMSIPTQRKTPVRKLAEMYTMPLLTVVVFIFFSFFPLSAKAFPSINNLNVILGSQAVVALIAIAAIFPLICGHMDFSVGATAAMAQVMCAGLMVNNGLPLWIAMIIPVLLGLVVGLVNGFFVTRLHMSPFVTTLGMMMLVTGLMIWYTGGQTLITGIDPNLIRFGSSRWFGLPAVFFIMLIVAVIAWYVFTHTPFGRSLYAIGSNPTAARLVGLPVMKNTWMAFVIAGGISGLAGVMQLARTGSAAASDGGTMMFPALAAVFLGATAIRPGFFNVPGTIIGAIFVSISVSGLALSGASGWASNVFNGVALLAAVCLSTYLGRQSRRN